uniref:Ragulator complex protein LAMTOR1 n=1 Tax=Lygus hesperus TaxID=30085 RepID=A0A0A9WRN2_LYGHE
MGCSLSSCCGESSDQNGEPSERTTLLSDPVASSGIEQRIPSDELSGSYCSSVPKKSDEQSVMNKILHETATNVIDVAALGPHAIEQNEYLERKNFYKIKVGPHLNLPWLHTGAYHKCILFDIPDPERVVASLPIGISDYNLMSKVTGAVSKAMEGLTVNHKEDLIVPFQIP